MTEDKVDGGFVTTALGHGIATQGDTLEQLRDKVRDAVQCHFDDGVAGDMPKVIRLHIERDAGSLTQNSHGGVRGNT